MFKTGPLYFHRTFKESLSLRTPANLLRIIPDDKFVHSSDLLHRNQVDAFCPRGWRNVCRSFFRSPFSLFWPRDSVVEVSLFRRHKKSTSIKSRQRLIVIANTAEGFFATKKKNTDICKRALTILQPTQAECLLHSWLYDPSYIPLCYIDIMRSWNNIEPV